MNTTLTSDPIFFQGILAFPLDGGFINTEGHNIPYEPDLPSLPLYIQQSSSKRAQLQVMVSQRTLNSLVWQLHLADKIVVTEKVSSTYLKTFFPNFEEVYGHKENLQIVLHSESAPQIQISEGLSEVTMQGRLRFLNPYNPHYDAVSLSVKVSAKIEFELLHDFTIAGKVVDM